jgi:hypothetical protein
VGPERALSATSLPPFIREFAKPVTITQVQRGKAVRRKDSAAVFVDSSVAAIQHDDGRMCAAIQGEESVPTMPSVRIGCRVTPGPATCRSSVNSARISSGFVASSYMRLGCMMEPGGGILVCPGNSSADHMRPIADTPSKVPDIGACRAT